jgi:archaellum biogenesis ATPase FlaH
MNDNAVYLTDDNESFEALRHLGKRVHRLTSDTMIDLGGPVEVIVVGPNAKTGSTGLVARGIRASRISYCDSAVSDPRHLFWDDVVPLTELEAEVDFPVYPSGISFLDKNLGWGWRLSELAITAGPYSSGKSTFGQILAANFVHGAGRLLNSGAMLCSWEDVGEEVKRNFSAFSSHVGASDIMDRVHLVRRPAHEDRLISWYMNLVTYHRERYNTRFFLLDPWNEMDHVKHPRQAETEYVRDILKEFKRLVFELEIIVMITTHVSAAFVRGNGEIEPFKIGHSFGSSQFGNKADRGLCVLRTKNYEKEHGHAIIRLDKAKVERKMGRRGTVAARFNPKTFSLEYDGHVTHQLQEIWKD